MDVAKLTAGDLDEFYARLAARGLSTTTGHHYHALIRASLNQAIRWGWLVPPNPAGAAAAPAALPRRAGAADACRGAAFGDRRH
jgi:hypothetical protein